MPLYPFNPNAGQTIQGQTPTVASVDMAFLAHYRKMPVAVAGNTILTATALTVAAQPGYTTGLNQPDVPRCVSIVGSQAGQNGVVTINGTDVSGVAISDSITSNATSTVNGVKAFKTITSIDLPARNGASDTIAVGVTNKLGLPHKLFNALMVLVKLFNAATDAGTVAADGTDLCKNLYTPAGTLDGAKYVDLFYMV